MVAWFNMGREDGGHSWYEDGLPSMMTGKFGQNAIIVFGVLGILTAVFVFFGFICRKHRILPALKCLVCGVTGVLLFPTMINSSWGEAEKSVLAYTGPNTLPVKSNLGFRSGIWKVDVYMETPGVVSSEDYIEEEIPLEKLENMHRHHLSALNEGWAWPLLFVTSSLGGEKLCWDAVLGKCLYEASCATEPCAIGSTYLWALWVLSLKFTPEESPIIMIILGISLIATAVTYCYIIVANCPHIILPDGGSLSLGIGWSGQVIGGLGICFCVIGFGLKLASFLNIRVTESVITNSKHSSSDKNIISQKTRLHLSERIIRFKENEKIKLPLSDSNERSECILRDCKRDHSDTRGSISPTARSQMFVL